MLLPLLLPLCLIFLSATTGSPPPNASYYSLTCYQCQTFEEPDSQHCLTSRFGAAPAEWRDRSRQQCPRARQAFCVKVDILDAARGSLQTLRGCTSRDDDRDRPMRDGCMAVQVNGGVQVTCLCSEDLCNGGAARIDAWALLGAVLAGAVIAVRY